MQTQVLIPVVVLTLAASAVSTAWAEPPHSWAIEYDIHATPADPNSPLEWAVTLSLSRAALDGNSIGWYVDMVTLVQRDSGGNKLGAWTHIDPNVPTPDGLWWTQHADPNYPQTADFVLTPYLSGTADSDDPNGTDLIYEFEGVPFTGDPPYEVTGGGTYSFTLVGDPEPIDEGETNPLDVKPN